MAVSREFEEYVVDQLACVGRITARRMFGGVGLYLRGTFFALIAPASRTLYFRVDDSNRDDYRAAKMRPFTPQMKGRVATMPYYEVPADVLEDLDQLQEWATKAFRAARRSGSKAKARPGKQRKP